MTPTDDIVANLNISGLCRELEIPKRETITIKFRQGVLKNFSFLANFFIRIKKLTLNSNKKKFQRKFKIKKLSIRLLTNFFMPSKPAAPGYITVLNILGNSHESMCQYPNKLWVCK